MRLAPALLAVALAACASPADAPTPEADPAVADAGVEAVADTSGVQAWLAEARSLTDTADFEARRPLGLALAEHADWMAACDGREAGEPAPDGVSDDPTRGVVFVDDLGDDEALVSVLCFLAAYQGPTALVHIDGPRATVLSAPAIGADGRPTDATTRTFITPDASEFASGILTTFEKARGLGDCGTLVRYAHDGGAALRVEEVRQRDCEADIPADLPPPEAWPVVYAAE